MFGENDSVSGVDVEGLLQALGLGKTPAVWGPRRARLGGAAPCTRVCKARRPEHLPGWLFRAPCAQTYSAAGQSWGFSWGGEERGLFRAQVSQNFQGKNIL